MSTGAGTSKDLEGDIGLASTPGFASLKLVHTSQSRWPLPAAYSGQSSSAPRAIHIAVMDSSFNPPHLAHLGMATSAFPAPVGQNANTASKSTAQAGPGPYTARLLLFSARNVDKKPKPGDATTLQRVQMTILLAQEMSSGANDIGQGGVAVGLINEPTFAGKSKIIHAYLHSYFVSELGLAAEQIPQITLSFLIGTDTLIRFFDEKYYPQGMQSALSGFFEPPPKGEGSVLISARRGDEAEGKGVEHEVFAREGVKDWVDRGCIRIIGSAGEGLEDVSSTEIRQAAAGQGADSAAKLRSLVPPSIADFIAKEGLYRD